MQGQSPYSIKLAKKKPRKRARLKRLNLFSRGFLPFESDNDMANICHISPQVVDEISQSFNTPTICSNKETFDFITNSKLELEAKPPQWQNTQRRKYITDKVAERCKHYEITLPKEDRGEWNGKLAHRYVKTYHQGGEIIEADEIYQYTTYLKSLDLTDEQIEAQFALDGIETITNKFGEPILQRTEYYQNPNRTDYNHTNNIGNQKRWSRMLECKSELIEVTDRTNNAKFHKAKTRCNDKLCLNCSQLRSRLAIYKYKDIVNKMEDPVMVVLHMESPGIGELKNCINRMYDCWRYILQKSNENFNGITALEVTTNNDKKTYHPHYHIIIERSQAQKLMDAWIDRMSYLSASFIVKTKTITRGKRKGLTLSEYVYKDRVRQVDEEERLNIKNKMTTAHRHLDGKFFSELPREDNGDVKIKELFKYAMKMSVTNQNNPGNKRKKIGSIEMIYEIAKSLQGVQQWRPFGNFRQTPNQSQIAEIIKQDMTVNREDHPYITLAKKWKWNGTDWEGEISPNVKMKLIGKPIDIDSIAFIQSINNFVNDKIHEPSNKPEQPQGSQILKTPGED